MLDLPFSRNADLSVASKWGRRLMVSGSHWLLCHNWLKDISAAALPKSAKNKDFQGHWKKKKLIVMSIKAVLWSIESHQKFFPHPAPEEIKALPSNIHEREEERLMLLHAYIHHQRSNLVKNFAYGSQKFAACTHCNSRETETNITSPRWEPS